MRQHDVRRDFHRLAILGDGFIELSAAGKCESQIEVGGGQVGLDFQGLAEMGDGLVHLSAAGQGNSEVVVGHGEVGLDFQGLRYSVMASSNCPRLASVAQVVVGLGVVGLDFQGLAVMGDGLVDLSAGWPRQCRG